jgi:tripartite-type tricarboxylate transporter receptor subunit TctC
MAGLPTVSDFVPGYESSQWYGIGAPRNTSAEIVDRLNREINAGLADPKIKARLADLGGMTLVGSPQTRCRRNREMFLRDRYPRHVST